MAKERTRILTMKIEYFFPCNDRPWDPRYTILFVIPKFFGWVAIHVDYTVYGIVHTHTVIRTPYILVIFLAKNEVNFFIGGIHLLRNACILCTQKWMYPSLGCDFQSLCHVIYVGTMKLRKYRPTANEAWKGKIYFFSSPKCLSNRTKLFSVECV